MTELLQKAIAEIKQLTPEQQDAIASRFLTQLASISDSTLLMNLAQLSINRQFTQPIT